MTDESNGISHGAGVAVEQGKSAASVDMPPWLQEALQRCEQAHDHWCDVSGARAHYVQWGEPGRQGLLLIHGGAAHAHWWGFVAPFLSDDFDVSAMDLFGMGQSDHLPAYSATCFAEEVLEVCEHWGHKQDIILVAHSFGAMPAIKAASLAPERFAGLVIMDSAVLLPAFMAAQRELGASSPFGRGRIYPDRELALSRFRLVPPQDCAHPLILRHLAEHGLERHGDGWRWRFDPGFITKTDYEAVHRLVPALDIPCVFLYGERSALFPPEQVASLPEVLGSHVPIMALPAAGHHMMLDRPMDVVAKLRELLQPWRCRERQG